MTIHRGGKLFEPLTLRGGPAWPNRLALAPLTSQQSDPDGQASDDELRWLQMRAQGGFGLVMTCAAHVQAVGQGFPGQLGAYSDDHIAGLSRLAHAIRAAKSVSSLQLHHAGIRAASALVDEPVGPSEHEPTRARALTTEEVEQIVNDFAAAAARAESAGFDGVEIHGAHGYLISQFMSPKFNRRTDRYGGSPTARGRLLLEIVDAIGRRCRSDFQVGVRLSPERFGLVLGEVRDVCAELLASGGLDYVDLSLWDCTKEPVEDAFRGRSLLNWFTDLERYGTRLGAAGMIRGAQRAAEIIENGADFVLIGRAAILHHDFPVRVQADATFVPVKLPVTPSYLAQQGVSPRFVDYIRTGWQDFVDDSEDRAKDAHTSQPMPSSHQAVRLC